MRAPRSVTSIMADIEGLLAFLEERDSPADVGEEQLRAFYEQLTIHSSIQGDFSETVELEFYSLLEQWPRLRRCYLAMSQVKLNETCTNALQRLVRLSHERNLSADEATQKRNLEQALRETTEQINDLLKYTDGDEER